MIVISKLRAQDIFLIEKRPTTEGILKNLSLEAAEQIAALPHSYAARAEGGRLLAIGGLVPRWEGRAEAWALFAPRTRAHLPELTQLAKDVIAQSDVNRIEFAVRCDFPEGHEWAMELGFSPEAECLSAYDQEGNDCSIYARVLKTKPRKVT